MPKSPADRARARWIEEFADTRMGDVYIWQLFRQIALEPAVFGRARDQSIIDKTLREDIPQILDYLEHQLPAEGFCFGPLGIADISLGVVFRNAQLVRHEVDAARWPRTAAYVARVLGHDALAHLRPMEDLLIRTRIPRQREALLAAGAPLTATSFATDTLRPGVMRI